MAIKINRFSFSVSGKESAPSGTKPNVSPTSPPKGQESKKTLTPKSVSGLAPTEKIKEQQGKNTETGSAGASKKRPVTFSANNAFLSRKSVALSSGESMGNLHDEESERSCNLAEDTGTYGDEDSLPNSCQGKLHKENEDSAPKDASSRNISVTGKSGGFRFSLSGATKMFGQSSKSGKKDAFPDRGNERHGEDVDNEKNVKGSPITDRRPTINFMKKPNIVIRPYCSYRDIDGKYPSDARQVQSNIRFTVHDRNLAIKSGLKWE